MGIRLKCYDKLVNQVPGIQQRYKKKRSSVEGIQRIEAWSYLIGLNILYHVFHYKKIGKTEKYPFYEIKTLYEKGSESSLSQYGSVQKMVEELAEYDVISFDVFDTLIFRPFSDPTDLFYFIGDKLSYMDFKRIRQELEWKAREKKFKDKNTYEVNLEEIYDVISTQTGIEKDTGILYELQFEKKYCFANPYMYEVVKELKKLHKRIIIISDMYLNTKQIQDLLQNVGYEVFDNYYVSCDLQKSKSDGHIYEYVKTCEKELLQKDNLKYIHIGDNYISDIENAQKHGFKTKHYINVNVAGKQFRPYDMSSITGSIYRGIVNAHIHNGLKEYSKEYEYGFIYGGLFVTGYCQFIHDYVQQHNIEKILFLARDGDILRKAYEKLYPEEKEKCKYIYWSRLAATKMSASYFKYDYFRRFLYHKINQDYSLHQIFSSMELDDMLDPFLQEFNYKDTTQLTDKNVQNVKEYLGNLWEEVLGHYEEQLEAAKIYFDENLENSRQVLAVDIGWAGSGAIMLDYIVNSIWNMNCNIIGMIAGTNSCHNAEPDTSETFLQSGKLVSYMYSQRENRDLWKLHNPDKKHNLYWEMLLDAPHGSLRGFYPDLHNDYKCRFKEYDGNTSEVLAVQYGILEFVEKWKFYYKDNPTFFNISGRDAYAPMILAMSGNYMKNIMGMMDDANI
mgnify:CR=1 FL=1